MSVWLRDVFEFGYEIRECGLSNFRLDGTSDATLWRSSMLTLAHLTLTDRARRLRDSDGQALVKVYR